MERERLTPEELTGSMASAYPNSMPEGVPTPENAIPNQNADASAQSPINIEESINTAENLEEIYRANLERVRELNNILRSNSDVGARRAAQEQLDEIRDSFISSGGMQQQSGERRGRHPNPAIQSAQEGEDKVTPKMFEESVIKSFDANNFTNKSLESVAKGMKIAHIKGVLIRDKELLNEFEAKIRNIRSHDPESISEADMLLGKIAELKKLKPHYVRQIKSGTERTLSLQLTEDDFDRINQDPMDWIREKFNKIYELSQEGAELDSQQLREAQSMQQAASRYLTSINKSPELIRLFDKEFLTKLNLLYASATVQQRNLEGITGMATKLGTNGLLESLSFEEGMVGMMHNRIQELYDDVRIRSENHHITPDEHSRVQNRVIDEFSSLILSDDVLLSKIIKDVPMSDERKAEVVRNAVIRSVRSGYNHFVASQREAVTVARGNALTLNTSLEGLLADPSGLFNMFNFEQLLIEKFGMLNHEQRHFFDELKIRYATAELKLRKKKDVDSWVRERLKIDPSLKFEDDSHGGHGGGHGKAPKERTFEEIKKVALKEYGQKLYRDLMIVNDFYSAGWRVERFTAQIDDIFKYKAAEQLLAVRNPERYQDLKSRINKKSLTSDSKDDYLEKSKAQLEYSQEIKAIMDRMSDSEIASVKEYAKDFGLFMRLRAIHTGKYGDDKEKAMHKKDTWQRIAKYRPEDVVKIFRERGNNPEELGGVYSALSNEALSLRPTGNMTPYDAFKDKYGAALRLVRERGLAKDMPEQIDFSQINSNPRYAEYRNLLIKALAKNKPEEYANAEKEVNALGEVFGAMKGFAGNENTVKKLVEDTRFEEIYLRTYTVDDALLDKMETVDINAGLTTVSRKLDPEAAGNAYRRTMNDAKAAGEAHGAFLSFLRAESSEDKLKATMAAAEAVNNYNGVDGRAKVFRQLYGNYMLMGAIVEEGKSPLNTLYEILDWKLLPFKKPVSDLQRIFGPNSPAFNIDEMFNMLEHHKNDLAGAHGMEMWEEMKRLSRTKAKDRTRFQTYRGIFYGMLWVILEAYLDTTKTIKAGLETDALK